MTLSKCSSIIEANIHSILETYNKYLLIKDKEYYNWFQKISKYEKHKRALMERMEYKPSSIIITTLSAKAYSDTNEIDVFANKFNWRLEYGESAARSLRNGQVIE